MLKMVDSFVKKSMYFMCALKSKQPLAYSSSFIILFVNLSFRSGVSDAAAATDGPDRRAKEEAGVSFSERRKGWSH